MAKAFHLFHLSLIAPSQLTLFPQPISREDWLRRILGAGFKFVHYKKDFYWVPKQSDRGTIIGIIERKTSSPRHEPPHEGGGEIVEEIWQGAVVIIDPAHHDDGQKLAFELDKYVGSPNAVLGSFLLHINEARDKPYTIEAKPIFNAATFWEFAKEHGNRLRNITFDFVVPNMWDTKGRLDKDLRDTGDETGSQKVKVSFESTDGVAADSQRIREGVEYSERGGASITARSLNNDRYSSTKRTLISKIDEEPINATDQTNFWGRIAGKILGRG